MRFAHLIMGFADIYDLLIPNNTSIMAFADIYDLLIPNNTAIMGFATNVIPRWFTYYVSTLLFFIFGLKMLKEG